MYVGFFPTWEDAFVDSVAEAAHDAGFVIPMLCCSPDFTNPDSATIASAIEKEADMIRPAPHGGPGSVCILSGQAHPEVPLEQGLEWWSTPSSS